MRWSAELGLLALALALYLYDAVLLLASDEAVLVRGGRGRWFAGFGAHRWRLGGREPYLPNPLTPHRPIYRLRWSFVNEAGAAAKAAPGQVQVPAALAKVGPFTVMAGLCLFVALPLGLLTSLGTPLALGAIVLLYLNNLIALALVFRWRDELGLGARQWASLAFECLACPPFAVNLVRRLSLRQAPAESFTAAAARLLAPDDQAAWRAQCLVRLDEQVAFEDEGSARMRALQAARARFVVEGEP